MAPASSSWRLGLLGVFLRHLLEHRLRGAVDEVLGLLEAEAREGAHLLDDLDLLVAGRGEDDVELVLLLLGGGAVTGAAGTGAATAATGAAAVTPNFSSKSFSSSLSSSTLMLAIASRISSLVLPCSALLVSAAVVGRRRFGLRRLLGRSSAALGRVLRRRRLRWPRLRCVGFGGLGSGRARRPRRRRRARRSAPAGRRRSCGAGPGAGRRTAASARPSRPPAWRAAPRGTAVRPAPATSAALSSFVAEHAALDDEVRVGPGEVPQRLGHRTGPASPSTNAMAVGPVSSSSISRPRSRAANRTSVFL